MPDGASVSALSPPAASQPKRFRPRWVSPLLRRILLVNALPLVLLVAAVLYLDQYQNGLLEAQVAALREQARVFAGALGESAVSIANPENPKLIPDVARPLLDRLTDPTPDADAKLYAPDGTVIADSRVRPGPGGAVGTEPLPPAVDYGPQQLRPEFGNAALYPPHQGRSASGDRGRTGGTRPPHRRHRAVDA